MVVKFKVSFILWTKFKYRLFNLRLWELEVEHFRFLNNIVLIYNTSMPFCVISW